LTYQDLRYQRQSALLHRSGVLAAYDRGGKGTCHCWSISPDSSLLFVLIKGFDRPSLPPCPTSKPLTVFPVRSFPPFHSSRNSPSPSSSDCSSKAASLSFHEGLTEELRHLYLPHSHARAIRTSVVCPAHFKSEMFAGFKGTIPEWLAPSLEVGTVAGLVCETVWSGESQVR
jgi:NAD(P)-dependent dehydrogenase (short-subunit alcohol dehydrogenase family)